MKSYDLTPFLSAAVCMLLCRVACGAAEGNLIGNGAFERVAKNGLAEQWQASGPLTKMGLDAGAQLNGRASQRLEGSGRLTMWQQVAVAPNTELLFRAWVKSDDRIVVRMGRRTLSYSDQGRWQKLVGLVHTKTSDKLKVEFLLGGFTQPPSPFWLNSVSLSPVKRLPTPRHKTFGPTMLVSKRQPAAFIVYPSSVSEYVALANKVQAAVAQCTGATLPIVSDADATQAKHPVLKPQLEASNLILLGRLGINRAMWPAYGRFLCAADGYYPGGDGYVVRTAANVMRNGKNHVVLGGSSETGAARAVDAFAARVRNAKLQADGSLVLPWLLDVELGGKCKAAFEADDKLWATDPWNSLLPPKEPGYGTVRRWYHNAMAYYWSGWPSYKQRMFTCLEPVLRDRARTHHYIAEFWVRTYDMLDDSGVFTRAQMAAMDDLIVKNFWEFATGPDITWMTTFSPPYDAIRFTSRHNIAPWMADIVIADFVQDYFKPRGVLGEIAKFRAHEKQAFMRDIVRKRWGSSLPGAHYSRAEEEIVKSMFRYALDHEAYEFFDNGNAKRALHLDKIDHLEGLLAQPWGPYDHHLMLGILAHYYHDGRYAALRKLLPIRVHPTGHFMGRYVNGVRRFMPGPELELTDPDAFTGVRIPRMMPHDQRFVGRFRTIRCRATGLDAEHALDFIAFRSGFDADDDYFALNGLAGQHPPGVILSFISCGAKWLAAGWSSVYGPTTDSYFDFNAVNVLRTDRWLDEKKPYAAVARLDWVARIHRAGGVGMTLDPFMDTAWRREVVWVQPRLFVVRDTITARDDGRYEIAVTWRPRGAASWDGKTWTAVLGSGRLRITPMGQRFRVRQNVGDYRAHRAKRLFFRHVASVQLAKRESVAATTLLEAFKPDGAVHDARLVDSHRVVLAPQKRGEAVSVRWAPIESDTLRTDARALVTSPSRLQAMAATSLQWRGKPVLSASQPISLWADCANGKLTVDGGKAGAALTLMPGPAQFVAQLRPGPQRFDLPAPTASALKSLLSQDAAAPTEPETVAETPTEQGIAVADQTARWARTWAYDGLKRPARVRTVTNVTEGVVDLGSVVELDEIRAVFTGRMWAATRFPKELWTALPDKAGHMPPVGSPAWRKLSAKPQWRASVRTGNYGRAEPVDKAFQFVKPKGLRARFVCAPAAEKLLYYDAKRFDARMPMRLEVADLDCDQSPEVVVAPRVWPPFCRSLQDEDPAFAVLRADGREVFQHDSPMNVQTLRLLDVDGSGRLCIVVATIDAKIRIFEPDGKLLRELDMFQMHREFNRTEGRPNTRHPAGLYTMPYALGLWRPGADGWRKLIVARYHSFSFIDGAGKFEGVLMTGSYVQPGLLPQGIDFNGDRVEEQLCVARGALFHFDGDAKPTVRDPGGACFYPQVYQVRRIAAPRWDNRLNGGPLLAFEALPWGEKTRYVLVARDDYLGIYDGAAKRWAFTWAPITSLRAAAVVEAGTDRLRVLAGTEDGLLWELTWQGKLDRLAGFEAKPFPDTINKISANPQLGACAVIAADRGAYVWRSMGHVALAAKRAYQDAKFIGSTRSLVAVDKDGRVERLDGQVGD